MAVACTRASARQGVPRGGAVKGPLHDVGWLRSPRSPGVRGAPPPHLLGAHGAVERSARCSLSPQPGVPTPPPPPSQPGVRGGPPPHLLGARGVVKGLHDVGVAQVPRQHRLQQRGLLRCRRGAAVARLRRLHHLAAKGSGGRHRDSTFPTRAASGGRHRDSTTSHTGSKSLSIVPTLSQNRGQACYYRPGQEGQQCRGGLGASSG